MSTYEEYAKRASSEKITLCQIEPSERLVLFSSVSGNIYKRKTNFYVIGVTEDDTILTEASNSSLSSGQWFYDPSTSELYINSTDDEDPKKHEINVIYRLFFSNAPVILPHDLTDGGVAVDYEARLISNSPTNKEIDEEQIGIALESKTNVKFLNKDGYFDDLFDTLFWENKDVRMFSYFRELPISEKRKLFEGVVQEKPEFTEDRVGFTCKDYLFKLRESVQQERFSESDGSVPDSILGTPKRRIYGKVKQLQTAPIDAVLGGYDLTGTLSGTTDINLTGSASGIETSSTVSGVGTKFLTELYEGATVIYIDEDGDEKSFTVDTISSDTSLTTVSPLAEDFSSGLKSDAKATILTGVGTAFLDEMSPRDIITIDLNGSTFEAEISTVVSDTRSIVSDVFERTFSGETIKNKPERPWRKKNRRWHIAGHKLRAPVTTITGINFGNRYILDSVDDLFPGDLLDFDGTEDEFIKRISNNEVILESILQLPHLIGGTVTKNPVSKVYVGTNEAFINRDWDLVNGASDAIIELEDTTEFNIAKVRSMSGTFSFVNGSRVVNVSNVNPLDYLKPRDWIRNRDDLTHQTFYEVLDVSETQIVLRVAYAGDSESANASIKNPELIGDNTLVTVDTMGMERNGKWIKTGPDAVRDMIENDIAISDIDTDSFNNAAIEAPYILSMAMPTNIGGDSIQIKTAITRINESIFGSLSNDNDFNVTYDVLSPERPADVEQIYQDDTLTASFRSRSDIVNRVIATYRPFVDIYTGENAFASYEFDNDFVNRFIGTKNDLEIQLLLFEDASAKIVAQRYALFNSLSQSTITLSGKLNLALFNLNQKVLIHLDRMYKRFGGRTNSKFGIINKISKTGTDASITINDLGNMFNRVGAIADNSSVDFTDADEDEIIKNGYIVDNDTELPDNSSDNEIFTNLIG